MRFNTLAEWLDWQQALHPRAMDLGLERVSGVARRLDLNAPEHPVITVAGTNGKGSCVAMLESILCAADYRVGSFTSPHLLRYSERIRLLGESVEDRTLCEAFAAIDAARGEISLSYFEFGALAAMYIFAQRGVEVALLEVGLGGRLDAVNLLDADLAVITGIAIEHTEWLGKDREAIGFEKAGILRTGRPAVCGDPAPPASIVSHAQRLHAPLHVFGCDYHYRREADRWRWFCDRGQYDDLPLPALTGEIQLRNASTVLMGLALMAGRLPVTEAAVHRGLKEVCLAGRFQRIAGPVETVLDVAHNPDGAAVLADNLRDLPVKGRTHAVFAVLADKNAAAMAEAVAGQVNAWYLSQVANARALPANVLAERVLARSPNARMRNYPRVTDAYHAALDSAQEGDRIVVFGSFYTVAEILALII